MDGAIQVLYCIVCYHLQLISFINYDQLAHEGGRYDPTQSFWRVVTVQLVP